MGTYADIMTVGSDLQEAVDAAGTEEWDAAEEALDNAESFFREITELYSDNEVSQIYNHFANAQRLIREESHDALNALDEMQAYMIDCLKSMEIPEEQQSHMPGPPPPTQGPPFPGGKWPWQR